MKIFHMDAIEFRFFRILCLIAMLFCVFSTSAQQLQIPQSYIAFETIDSIIIDGHAHENSWKKLAWSTDFIDIEGVRKPKYRTRMKMVYDADNLYIFAQLEEPHVWATLKQRDTVIFYNNDFEVFLDPDGDTHNYMEYEMNALNTVWDLLLTKPYRNDGKILDAWDFKGFKSASSIDGTLNDPSDTDKGWSVEIALPWKVLREAATFKEPPVDTFWRINFSRVNWRFELKNGRYSRKKDSAGNYLPEYNWVWSPQQVINMHEPERWGYVYFSSKKSGEKDSFEIPRDEQLKWALYDLYRQNRVDFDQKNSGKELDKSVFLKPIIVDGKKLIPKIEIYQNGWNLSVISPFSKKILLIKEDGQFMELPSH